MKKFAFIIITSVVVFASCKKETASPAQNLIGSWYVYQITLGAVIQIRTSDSVLNDSITFNSNGQYSKVVFKLSGSTLDTISSAGTWQLSGGAASDSLLTLNTPLHTYRVVNLSNNGQAITMELHADAARVYYLKKNNKL